MRKKTILKSYQKWKSDNPNFYSNLGVDVVFERICDDWFKYRYTCDEEDKFNTFYKRRINSIYDKYNEIVSLEGIRRNCDYFIYNFNQDWRYGRAEGEDVKNTSNTQISTLGSTTTETADTKEEKAGSDTITYNSDESLEKESKNAGTQELKNTGTQTNNNTSSGKTSQSGESHANTEEEHLTNQRGLMSELPMSIINNGGVFDENSILDWATASQKHQDIESGQSKTKNDTNNSVSGESSGTNNATRTDDLTQLRTDDLTNNSNEKKEKRGSDLRVTSEDNGINTNRQVKTSGGDTINNTGVDRGSSAKEDLNYNLSSGRQGKGPAEIINEAYNIVTKFCSIDFVYYELNKCFFGLDLEEYEPEDFILEV